MSFSHIHISQFSIEAPSTRFYANGNHQCHIRVRILKQGINNSNGMLVSIPLTTQERNSVSAALLSSSLENSALVMPNGWNVSSARNGFDLGLVNQPSFQAQSSWSRHPDEQSEDEFKNAPCFSVNDVIEMQEDNVESVLNIEQAQQNNVPEIINLYVTATATGIQTIMAKALVEVSDNDQTRTITITTNMNSGNNIFNSNINLDAIVPFVIQPNMLSQNFQTIQDRRENVTKWDVHHQLITLIRWTLPFNLRINRYVSGNRRSIFFSLGNDHQSNRFLTSGRFYPSGRSSVNARDAVRGGCVWDFAYSVNVTNNQMVASILHVTGCSWTSGISTGTHTVVFIDNFGNRQGFILSPEDTGRKITINRSSV